MKGVRFGDIHTYDKWKLILQHTDIGFPDLKREKIDIPGADGELDFSKSLTGDMKYKNRTISFTFITSKKYEAWKSLVSEIANFLHGQEFKIRLDEDSSYYYVGTAKINQFQSDRSLGVITVECDVDPYKYDITSSDEDWLWDPFNFEDGIINNTKDLVVDGELEVVIYGRRKRVAPWITCDNAMTVIFNSNTYNLLAKRQKVLNIEICEGENVLKFVGNGKVTIEYRGGSL